MFLHPDRRQDDFIIVIGIAMAFGLLGTGMGMGRSSRFDWVLVCLYSTVCHEKLSTVVHL